MNLVWTATRAFVDRSSRKGLSRLTTPSTRAPYVTAHRGISKHQEQSRLFHNPGAQERFNELGSKGNELYPRLAIEARHISCRDFVSRFHSLEPGARCKDANIVLYGRVSGLRSFGSKLFFVDIKQDGQRVQTICNYNLLDHMQVQRSDFKTRFKDIQIGDTIKTRGDAHKTASGELSLLLKELPHIVSPCLPPLPFGLIDKQTKMRKRYVDFIVNPSTAELIRTRSVIIQHVRQFLLDDGQLEVQTPILASEAGGAAARPFETRATEFTNRKLTLRIAPELWLKRMVVGGFERIFEIGASFRNEGIDLNHNPEFTSCEFYRTFTDISKLMEMTEIMLAGLANSLQERAKKESLAAYETGFEIGEPFRRLDFIPTLESALKRPLPRLDHCDAEAEITQILHDLSLPVFDKPTLPSMLDSLSAKFLEPQCKQPTFLINHPECLSPLAKSFVHPTNHQIVAARAELFVGSTEIANMYEEENSPQEQRRKFGAQAQYCHDPSSTGVDESYLEALEWGLPPTGGWGAGIDRLCMLFTGADRINDVLAFGSLRNVVGRQQSQTLKFAPVEEGK